MNHSYPAFWLVSAVLVLSGCATEPFKTGRPVEVNGGFFSRSFTQEGKKLGMEDLLSELRRHEESRAAASHARTLQLVSLIPAGVGGYLIGYSLASSSAVNSSKDSQLLIGIGLLGVTTFVAYFSDQYLVEGVDAYNRKLAGGARAGVTLQPALGLAVIPTSTSAAACVAPSAGLKMMF